MKMFLLRETSPSCADCHMSAMVFFRAESEAEAREMATNSNSHGTGFTTVAWNDPKQVSCTEWPFLDGPKGIVVGSWFEQHQPG